MSDTVVGIMWNRNEADLLIHTIPAALEKVDCLLIIDDNSTDNSWDIIQSFKKKLEYCVRTEEKIQDTPYSEQIFAKQHLLDEVRKRFKPENTWVQIIESDVSILDTNIHKIINKYALDDVAIRWHMINACRRKWDSNYNLPLVPSTMSLFNFYDSAHWMEQLTYTFRPLPKLTYTNRATPYPQGFSNYFTSNISDKLEKLPDSSLLVHWGTRSPRYYHNRVRRAGIKSFSKYPSWDLSTITSIKKTIPFFNGEYNNNPDLTFNPISRQAWQQWLLNRKQSNDKNS